MSFDFLELDSVAKYLHLVVNSAQVMKRPGSILESQVPCAIPSLAFECRKTRRRKFGIIEIPASSLPCGHNQFPFLLRRQELEIRVHNSGTNAGKNCPDGQRSAISGHIGRIREGLRDAVDR